jgi:hypothetical protein
MNRFFFLLCLILFLPILVSAQENLQNTVILYNVVPLRVDLNADGTIQKVYGEDNTFLKGYNVVRRRPKVEINSDNYSNDLTNFVSLATENFDLIFDQNKAILNQSIVNNLDKASENLFFESERKMVLSTYKVGDDAVSRKLYKNRINGLLAYLDIKGIKKERIVISLDELTNAIEGFKISFVK